MTAGSSPEPRGTWGVVLAGTYLKGRSLFERLRPRPLLPVAHRPIISYPLRWLADAGVQGVTVCLNGESREVRGAVEAEPGVGPMAFLEDPTPRGTAGTARDAALATGAASFLVVNATAIPRLDPRALLDFHRGAGAAVTVLVRRETAPAGAGAGLGPAGVYVFDRRAFDQVPAQGFQDIKETLLTRLHALGERVATFETDSPGPRVLTTETYLAANESMIPRAVEGEVPAGFFRLGQALVHATRARLAAGAPRRAGDRRSRRLDRGGRHRGRADRDRRRLRGGLVSRRVALGPVGRLRRRCGGARRSLPGRGRWARARRRADLRRPARRLGARPATGGCREALSRVHRRPARLRVRLPGSVRPADAARRHQRVRPPPRRRGPPRPWARAGRHAVRADRGLLSRASRSSVSPSRR